MTTCGIGEWDTTYTLLISMEVTYTYCWETEAEPTQIVFTSSTTMSTKKGPNQLQATIWPTCYYSSFHQSTHPGSGQSATQLQEVWRKFHPSSRSQEFETLSRPCAASESNSFLCYQGNVSSQPLTMTT